VAWGGIFGDQPDVLVCSVDDPVNVQPWDQLVFYVSGRLEDGGILYNSLTSNPVLVTISPQGVVDAENLADCDGKTAASLRAGGACFRLLKRHCPTVVPTHLHSPVARPTRAMQPPRRTPG
jgi:hypothetical protein